MSHPLIGKQVHIIVTLSEKELHEFSAETGIEVENITAEDIIAAFRRDFAGEDNISMTITDPTKEP